MLFCESMAIRVKPIILWCKYRRSLPCDALSVWRSILSNWPISGEKILWGRNPKVWTVFGVCCIIWILPIFTKIHPKMQGVGLKALLDLSDESCNKVKVSKLQLIKSSHDSGLIPPPHPTGEQEGFHLHLALCICQGDQINRWFKTSLGKNVGIFPILLTAYTHELTIKPPHHFDSELTFWLQSTSPHKQQLVSSSPTVLSPRSRWGSILMIKYDYIPIWIWFYWQSYWWCLIQSTIIRMLMQLMTIIKKE